MGKTAINRQFSKEDVEAIEAWTLPQAPVDRRWVGLNYRSDPEGKLSVRLVGGQQLTVQPDNLLHALLAWKDPHPDEDPVELMDRIEAMLRARPQTGPDHQHWMPNPIGDYGMGLIGAASILGDASVAGTSRSLTTA